MGPPVRYVPKGRRCVFDPTGHPSCVGTTPGSSPRPRVDRCPIPARPGRSRGDSRQAEVVCGEVGGLRCRRRGTTGPRSRVCLCPRWCSESFTLESTNLEPPFVKEVRVMSWPSRPVLRALLRGASSVDTLPRRAWYGPFSSGKVGVSSID